MNKRVEIYSSFQLLQHTSYIFLQIDGYSGNIYYLCSHEYDEESFSATFRPDGGNLCPGYGQRQP